MEHTERVETGAGGDEPVVLGNRYRLEELIGGGGAADVYRAHDDRLGRPVAVKLFRRGIGVDDDRRFAEEARLLATLSHPGLVTVYDVGRYGDQGYLVLQLIEGETLAARLTDGPLDPDEVADIGAQLAEVLAHVHRRSIIHRDVKPGNVLCGRGDRLFLADFGISRLIDSERMTSTGLIVGTASYLAPEQVRGVTVGPPADVYALGLLLLECLTGRREYPGPALEAAMARLGRPPEIPPDLPPDLGALLTAMTAMQPEDRPSADECATALAGPAGEHAPPAHVSSGHAPFVAPVPTPPVPTARAVGAVPPTTGRTATGRTTASFGGDPRTAQPGPDEAAPRSRRGVRVAAVVLAGAAALAAGAIAVAAVISSAGGPGGVDAAEPTVGTPTVAPSTSPSDPFVDASAGSRPPGQRPGTVPRSTSPSPSGSASPSASTSASPKASSSPSASASPSPSTAPSPTVAPPTPTVAPTPDAGGITDDVSGERKGKGRTRP